MKKRMLENATHRRVTKVNVLSSSLLVITLNETLTNESQSRERDKEREEKIWVILDSNHKNATHGRSTKANVPFMIAFILLVMFLHETFRNASQSREREIERRNEKKIIKKKKKRTLKMRHMKDLRM